MIKAKKLRYVLGEARLIALGLLVMPAYAIVKFAEGPDYHITIKVNPPNKGGK